jgi:hypothetical protein
MTFEHKFELSPDVFQQYFQMIFLHVPYPPDRIFPLHGGTTEFVR